MSRPKQLIIQLLELNVAMTQLFFKCTQYKLQHGCVHIADKISQILKEVFSKSSAAVKLKRAHSGHHFPQSYFQKLLWLSLSLSRAHLRKSLIWRPCQTITWTWSQMNVSISAKTKRPSAVLCFNGCMCKLWPKWGGFHMLMQEFITLVPPKFTERAA